MRSKIISILFGLLIAAGTLALVLVPDKYYSESEKRTLKQFPEVSWKNIRSGKFGDDFEGYLEDQFPLRDSWVTLKTFAERASGKKENNGVYFAKDDYLIEVHTGFQAKQTTANVNAINMLQETLKEKDIPLQVMLVPTAGHILRDKLPAYAPSADQQKVIEFAEQLGVSTLDITDTLLQHKDEYIFYKTDHHWTSLGAYYAYAAWMEARGKTAEPLSAWQKEVLSTNFHGTTYAKVNDPFIPYDEIDAYYKAEKHEVNYNNGDYITDSIYERKYLSGSDQYATFLNSNQATTVVQGGGSGKLLILKDSYANCFAQFLIDDFEETHLIDLRFFMSSVKKYIEAFIKV